MHPFRRAELPAGCRARREHRLVILVRSDGLPLYIDLDALVRRRYVGRDRREGLWAQRALVFRPRVAQAVVAGVAVSDQIPGPAIAALHHAQNYSRNRRCGARWLSSSQSPAPRSAGLSPPTTGRPRLPRPTAD